MEAKLDLLSYQKKFRLLAGLPKNANHLGQARELRDLTDQTSLTTPCYFQDLSLTIEVESTGSQQLLQ